MTTSNAQMIAGAVALAAASPAMRINWRDRGRTPAGYGKGMAAAYALAYAGIKSGDPTAVAIVAPITKPSGDVLAHYDDQLGDAGLGRAPRLRQVFAILWGLGPRESSGQYCCGRDMEATQEEPISDTTEAGLFQQSYNLMAFSPLLKRVPVPADDGLLSIFREGVTPKSSDLTNWGSTGPGLNFQRDCKSKPLYAVMTAALGLRFSGGESGHWGPIRRHEAEVRPEVVALLQSIEAMVDQAGVPAPGVPAVPGQPASPVAPATPGATQVAPGPFSLTSEPGIRAVQARLSECGVFGPAIDGKAGPLTRWAVAQAGGIEALPGLKPLPLHPGDDFAGRVIRAMQSRGDWISRMPGTVNPVWLEGTEADGSENDNRPNAFNDRALLVEVDRSGVPRIVFNADATSEPSRRWTINPMHPQGAFHIDLGQHVNAWAPGLHHGRDAWVQVGVLHGTRDPDKTFRRDPRHPWSGDDMGVNIHWGYDLAHDDMGNSSAGCLVIRLDGLQREFMRRTRDARFMASPAGYRLTVSVLPQLSTMRLAA